MHDIALIFHDFLRPLLFSMTFQAWKLVCLNFMTFHDFPGPVVTLAASGNAILAKMSAIKGLL